MDNKKDTENGLSIAGIIGIIIFVLGLIILSVVIPENKQTETTSFVPSSDLFSNNQIDSNYNNEAKKSNFDSMSQSDRDRLSTIINGVIQNSISVTPELKQEVRNIFKKYNVTDKELEDFSLYGTAFPVIYQTYFYADALSTIEKGIPVKSEDRKNIEIEALSKGIIKQDRINTNDQMMVSISKGESVIGSNGKQVIFTESNIRESLNNFVTIVTRLNSLYSESDNTVENTTITNNEISIEDKNCEELHGPSVYKKNPSSIGGGAYCDCKPGYTLKITKLSDGTPSSWCFAN